MDGQDRKRRGWPKGRKRPKTMKDLNAPKKPLTGYVMFMRDRREDVMIKNPNLTMIEATKLLGEEWTKLPDDQKATYLATAESEKEKYLKTLEEYHKSDEYKKFVADCDMEFKQEASVEQNPTVTEEASSSQSADIPIFTEAFLDHNKEKESELHRLTKTNAEYEQQNSILETHLDNLRNAIVKLDTETESQNAKNETLFTKLNQFRSILFKAFSKIPLPTTGVLPTSDTIDTYMHDMFEILQNDVENNAEFAQSVYNVVSTLNFQPTGRFNHGRETVL